jgi:hypothetical protein
MFPPTPAGLVSRRDLSQMTDDPAAIRTLRERRMRDVSASEEAIALSRTEQEIDMKMSSADALKLVFKKNPELYFAYVQESLGGTSAASRDAGERALARQDQEELEDAQRAAHDFYGLIDHHEAQGLSKADAIRSAAKESPAGYDAHVRVTTRRSDGTALARR